MSSFSFAHAIYWSNDERVDLTGQYQTKSRWMGKASDLMHITRVINPSSNIPSRNIKKSCSKMSYRKYISYLKYLREENSFDKLTTVSRWYLPTFSGSTKLFG